MDPTRLPTDNLYKFIAVAGLTFAVASYLAMWHTSGLCESREEAFISQYKKFSAEEDRMLMWMADTHVKEGEVRRPAFERCVAAGERALKGKDVLLSSDASREEALYYCGKSLHHQAEAMKESEGVRKWLDDVRVTVAELEAKHIMLSACRDRVNWAHNVLSIFAGVAAAAAACGFLLWYQRHQRHMDRAAAHAQGSSDTQERAEDKDLN